MTLDDAIVAFGQLTSDDFDSLELDVRDYERLVNWLTELKLARESAFSDIGLAARAVSENNQLKSENTKLRDIAHDMWRLLLATGNDDLVLSIEASGVVKEVIDAEELAKTMRELGIEV